MSLALFYLLVGLIGLALGSFASVVIHRLHTGEEGIFWGRSKCPQCEKTLSVRDLIPLISFAVNRFRCRTCKKPIAWRYPALESVMAGSLILTAALTGTENKPLLVFYLFMTFVFVLLGFYDGLFREIPDSVSLPAIAIAILASLKTTEMMPKELLIGLAVPVAFFGLLFAVSRGNWLGGGDIRIGALMGALLGWPLIVVGMFLGYLLGAVFSVMGLISGKLSRKSHIPFAPFLLTGTYIALFWGEKIINWYLSTT